MSTSIGNHADPTPLTLPGAGVGPDGVGVGGAVVGGTVVGGAVGGANDCTKGSPRGRVMHEHGCKVSGDWYQHYATRGRTTPATNRKVSRWMARQ